MFATSPSGKLCLKFYSNIFLVLSIISYTIRLCYTITLVPHWSQSGGSSRFSYKEQVHMTLHNQFLVFPKQPLLVSYFLDHLMSSILRFLVLPHIICFKHSLFSIFFFQWPFNRSLTFRCSSLMCLFWISNNEIDTLQLLVVKT